MNLPRVPTQDSDPIRSIAEFFMNRFLELRIREPTGFMKEKSIVTFDSIPSDGVFDPSAFLRARRPYLFSDSEPAYEVSLSKSVFEYHLDTLTSRKQEYEFEHFARKLVEK